MASNLGQIFVELSLDDKIYRQKLADIEPNAVATAKGVETAWKALGTKAGESFDAQRRAAENAYNLIKGHATSTANDILRAEQAKNEKINALNEQQFGKTEGLLTKLKNNWIAAAAAVGAAYMATQKAWNMAEQAAKYEQSAQAFHSMATSMGKDATTEFEKIKKASGGIIDIQTLTEASNKAMSLGIPIEKIGDLMLIARAKARDMGTDAAQAFSDIATGVGRASPLILDNLGLVMKVGAANEAMAASLGKTVEQLTDQEKKTAILNATLAAGKEALARYNLEEKTTAEQMQTLKATLADVQIVLGQGIVRASALVVGSFQSLSAASMTVSAGLWMIIQAKERLQAMVSWGEAEKRHMDLAKEAAQNAQADFKSSLEYATKAQSNFKLMTASTVDMTAATQKSGKAAVETGKAQVKANEDAAKASKKAAADIKRDEEKIADAAKKRGQEIIDTYYDEKKAADNYYDNLVKESDRAQEKRAADAKRAGQDIIDSYYEEKQKADAFYDKLVGKAKESGEQRIQVEVDVFGEMSARQKQALIDSGTFFDGMKIGFQDIKDDALSFGQAGYEAIRTFADSSKTAMSDILFQGIKEGTIDAQAVWESFSDTMLRKFTDTVAEMVIEAAAADILMMFKAEWTAESSNILGIINKGMNIWNWLTGSSGGAISADEGVGSWAADAGGYGNHATGGPYEAGRPFWAGEKGPELIFPSGSGKVLTHEQSMAYASRNGGFIPGYADGIGNEGTAAQEATLAAFRAYWENLQGFGKGAEPLFRPANYYNDDDWWISPDGQLHDTRHADRGFLDWAIPAIIAIGGGYATGNVAVGTAIISSMMSGADGEQIALAGIMAYAAQAAGQYVGTAMSDIFATAGTGGAEALAGTGWSGLYDASDIWGLVSQIGMQAVRTVATNAVKASLKYALGSMFGGGAGGGSAEFSFAGLDSDFSWLTKGMAGIAPQSSGFGFSLASGLSYVPYDNFPARLHEGERVLTKQENRTGRTINFSPNIVINGSNLSPAQMAKQIVRPLQEEMRRLNARQN